jgi:hypothetical protein
MDNDDLLSFTRCSSLHELLLLSVQQGLPHDNVSLALFERPLPLLVFEICLESFCLVFGGKSSKFGIATLELESLNVLPQPQDLRIRNWTATFVFFGRTIRVVVDPGPTHVVLATVPLAARRRGTFDLGMGIVIVEVAMDHFDFAVPWRRPLLQDNTFWFTLIACLLWW